VRGGTHRIIQEFAREQDSIADNIADNLTDNITDII
jgi:hypothetical protein